MQSKKFELIRSTYASKDGYLGRKPLPPEIISLTDIIGELMCPGPFYYYVIDSPSLTFEQVSPHVSKVLGYDASEFQLETLVDIIHPEDFPFVNKCEEIIEK